MNLKSSQHVWPATLTSCVIIIWIMSSNNFAFITCNMWRNGWLQVCNRNQPASLKFDWTAFLSKRRNYWRFLFLLLGGKTSHDRIPEIQIQNLCSPLSLVTCLIIFSWSQWLCSSHAPWSSWSTFDSGLPSPLLILCHSKDKKSDRNLSISAPWFYNTQSVIRTAITTVSNHNQELSPINPLRKTIFRPDVVIQAKIFYIQTEHEGAHLQSDPYHLCLRD